MSKQVELAPEGCIICGKTKDKYPHIQMAYISGADPLGSTACIPDCVARVLENIKQTGRTDGKRRFKKLVKHKQ